MTSGVARKAGRCDAIEGSVLLADLLKDRRFTEIDNADLSSQALKIAERKRSLALREFALGIEALERFVRREPLRRVHECVFGVLALESEPVDPRL